MPTLEGIRLLHWTIAFLLFLSSTVSQSDCYVSLSLPTASVQQFRTKTVQNSRNPTWNETFHFTIQSQVKVRLLQTPPTAILTRYQAHHIVLHLCRSFWDSLCLLVYLFIFWWFAKTVSTCTVNRLHREQLQYFYFFILSQGSSVAYLLNFSYLFIFFPRTFWSLKFVMRTK